MRNGTADGRGGIVRRGPVWRIDNALTEEARTADGRNGYLIVSYATARPGGLTVIETLRLNVGRGTRLVDGRGRPVSLRDIRPGTWVDAEFTPFTPVRRGMPQANALRITVRQRMAPPNTEPPSVTTTDRVVRVDARNGTLLTGVPDDLSRQIRFIVTEDTAIRDRNGGRIPLRALQPGQRVRVTHANFMTKSLPPQTTAFQIQVL